MHMSDATLRQELNSLFTLTGQPQALSSSHVICILCNAGTIIAGNSRNGGRFLTCVVWSSRWLKEEKGEKKVSFFMAIMCDCLAANIGCSPLCLLLLPSQSDPPSPPCVCCSLSLLRSLSEDWGEPVSSRDESLLWDAAAVHEPRGWCRTEVAGRWRRSEVAARFHLFQLLHESKCKCLLLLLCGVFVLKRKWILI